MEATTRLHKRRGVSEVVSSVSMLAITIAILGGVGLISMGSLREANGLLLSDSEGASSAAGVLLTVVATQSNSTGTFVWLYSYGWTQTALTSVYLNGGLASGWSSTCSSLAPQQMCALRMSAGTHGTVSMDFGTRTLSVTV